MKESTRKELERCDYEIRVDNELLDEDILSYTGEIKVLNEEIPQYWEEDFEALTRANERIQKEKIEAFLKGEDNFILDLFPS